MTQGLETRNIIGSTEPLAGSKPGKRFRARWIAPAVVAAAWFVVVAGGIGILAAYSSAPGKPSSPPQQWPPQSALRHSDTKPTLVMFAHPRCPCTRASIGELARIMRACQDRVSCYVVFVPCVEPGGSNETDLSTSAAAIPGVRVRADIGGSEARRFGASTSGAVVLYDAGGRLLFHGGITAARGHAGDNVGEASVESLIRDGRSTCRQTSTFGCALFDPPAAGRPSAESEASCRQPQR